MNSGTVKWFNWKRVLALFLIQWWRMFLCIFSCQCDGYKALEDGPKVTFDTDPKDSQTQAINVYLLN